MLRLKKDRFSVEGPKWQEVRIKHSKEFEEIISLFKKLDLINKECSFRIYKIKGLEINSSNLLVRSNIKNFVVKRYKLSEKKHLNTQVDLYEFIREKGLSGPYILEDLSPVYEMESGESILFLEYEKGRYYKGSFADMQKAATTISNFIKEFQTFDSSKLHGIEILQKNSKNILDEFLNQKDSWQKKFGDEIANLLEAEWEHIKECENNSSKDIKRIKNEKKFALHIDLHPHNLLIHKEGCTVLDIDSIRMCYWPSAVGFAIFKLLRQSLTESNYDKEFEKNARNFISTITENIHLEASSWNMLFIGARIEILRRILIILEGNQGEEISPWNSVLQIQINALREVNLIRESLTLGNI